MTVPTPEAPFGVDPQGRPYSDKSKVVAGVLQLFLGTFGAGRFYVGSTGVALGQLFTCGGLGLPVVLGELVIPVEERRLDDEHVAPLGERVHAL
ncbi:TM2 domain-containing protein, partial [Streptomyces avermitilis]|uniref:TM2 domain-containing protein n=1 Tax=Streptomyces avermitilis TaxID=33903 RepID=UPI003F4B4E75